MKERLVSLLLALGALALFWVLFFPKAGTPGPNDSKPLSFEKGASGYLGLLRWLSAEGIAIHSLRHPYDHLTDATASASADGNLLITTMPHATGVRNAELPSLDSWIRKGNTLLIMAALDDTPRWSLIADGTFTERLRSMARIEFVTREEESAAKNRAGNVVEQVLNAKSVTLVPTGTHPMLRGVQVIASTSELPASRWKAVPLDSAPVFELVKRSDNGDPVVWLRSLGEGMIIVSAYATPFSNDHLGKADNARWLSNIVGWSLGRSGTVIFDDAHQGAVAYYDPAGFYKDPRLHHTLWWIVGLWLAYVLASQPLRPMAAARQPLTDTAMLRVSGNFLASMLKPDTAARQLFEHFFNRVRCRLALPENGEPVWDWLNTRADLNRHDLEELRRMHERIAAGRRVDLVKLQNLLSGVSGHLS
jgi:hypothetical protein